jgi:hypothetical protein
VLLTVADRNIDWHELPLGSGVSSSQVGQAFSSRQVEVLAEPAKRVFAGADLIKIDAEGIEASLIRQAWQEVITGRPILMLEVLPDSQDLIEVVRDLLAGGYLIRDGDWIGQGSWSSSPSLSANFSTHWGVSRDWLLVPKERRSQVPA